MKPWRLALLLALGGALLFASLSYDEWVLVHAYLTRGLRDDVARQVQELRWSLQARRDRWEERRRLRDALREARREARIQGSIHALFKESVDVVLVLPDGRLLAGGSHGRHGLGIARLEPDGRLDRAFADRVAASDIFGRVTSIEAEPGGAIVLGGHFAQRSHHVTKLRFLRLHEDGSVDGESVRPGYGEGRRHPSGREWLDAAAALPAGAVPMFVSAAPGTPSVVFFAVPPHTPPGWIGLCGNDPVLRFKAAAFDPPWRLLWQADVPPAEIAAALAQPDGGFVVMGLLRDDISTFAQPDGGFLASFGQVREPARIRAGERADATLLWSIGRDGLDHRFRSLRSSDFGRNDAPAGGPTLAAVAVQADGRIVVGGAFTSIRGQRRVHIARLRPDGTLEP